MLFNIYRTSRFIYSNTYSFLSNIITKILFYINNINIGIGFKSNGIPYISKHRNSSVKIGKNFKINNTIKSNPIGRSSKCIFTIRENSKLIIGNNVGISGSCIVCSVQITIGNNVKIGGNSCIYDTDFHSLNFKYRKSSSEDKKHTLSKSIIIEDDVFIGSSCTILKGTTIGHGSIVGACSVVTKNIPPLEIWAGNPAKFIRKVNQ